MSKPKLLLAAAVIAGACWLAPGVTPHARGGAAVWALAGPSDNAQATVPCDLSAYITDPDPKGTNVRSGPSKSAPVVKTLPTGLDTVVKINGYSGGWFQISRAETVGDEEEIVFQGRGWVHSSLLGLDVGNNGYGPPALYAAPSKQSRVLKHLKPDQDAIKLLACKDDWAKVQSGTQTGWLAREGLCANPLTTCP
jgi:SH3-like domain-containing protein